MEDQEKTKEQLSEQLVCLRRSFAELSQTVNRLQAANSNVNKPESYEVIFSNSPDAILIASDDAKIMYVNRAMTQMTGWSPDELCERRLDVLAHDNDSESSSALIQNILRDSSRVEIELQQKDGTIFLAEISSNVFKDFDGSIRFFILIRDITRKRKVLDALKNNEKQKIALLDAIETNIVFVNDRLEIIWANKKFADTLGKPGSELTGLTCHSLWAHLDKPCDSCPTLRAFKTGNPEHDTVVGAGGRVFTEKSEPIFDSNGNLMGIVEFTSDVTDYKKSENLLRQSESKYRSLIDNAPIGILMCDTSGYITEVNRACLKILGSPGSEATKSLNMLTFPPLVESGISNAVQECMTEKKVTHYDTSYTSKWGKQTHLRIILAPIFKTKDELEGCQAVVEDITERKKTEEALKQSLRRLEESQRIGKIGTWEWNSITGETYWSDEVYRIFGVERGSVTLSYELIKGLIIEDDIAKFEQSVLECLETGNRFQLDFRVVRADGSVIWLHNEADVIRDQDNQVAGLFGTTQDISHLKAVEDDLRETERIKSLVLNTTDEIFACYDRELNLLWCNKAFSDSARIPQDSMTGRQCFEIWHGRSQPCPECPVLLAMEKGEPQSNTVFSSRLERYRFIRAFPLFDENGNVEGAVEIAQDITERYKAEQALKESEERYRQLSENSLTGIFIHQDGICVYSNQRLEEILGYKKNEILGANIWEVLNCQDITIDQTGDIVGSGIEAQPSAYELPLIKKSGEEVWCQILMSLINYQGRPAMMANVYDITENKKLQIQLLQSQKMQAVGTLAAGIAHDFNNMLQIILGYTDLLMIGRNSSQPEYRSLQKIKKTVVDARDLVQKIRIFSKKADINPAPLDLNHQVDQVFKILSHSLPKNIKINLNLTEDLDSINADSGMMDQMIMNLAINASETMQDGGTLTISTENIVLDDSFCKLNFGIKPGPHVLLKITDTGRGIEKELLKRIFDPFYTTKARDYHKGTGLGLPVVQGIVEQHKGCITVESEVDKGTSFRIYLPVSEQPGIMEEESLPMGHNETILLVDDEKSVRELTREILEQFNYRVIEARDGQEALDIYNREHADVSLVFLDVIMPRLDGKKCLSKLLEIDPTVKVLIFSGVAEDIFIQDVVNLGAKGALIKPLDMKRMLQKIREVLDAN